MAGWHVVRLASLNYIMWMPVDAHAKEGSDVDILRHNVFSCFFKVSNGFTGCKKLCRGTHIQLLMCHFKNHIKKAL